MHKTKRKKLSDMLQKLHKIVQKEIQIEGVELSKEQNQNLSKILKENPPDNPPD